MHEVSFVEASLEDGKNGLHDVEERMDSLKSCTSPNPSFSRT